MLFYAGLLPSPSSIFPYRPKKTLRICTNFTTQHGRGKVGSPTRAHPWLLYCLNVVPTLCYQPMTVFVPYADSAFPVFFALVSYKTEISMRMAAGSTSLNQLSNADISWV